jgi:hypothetical protein
MVLINKKMNCMCFNQKNENIDYNEHFISICNHQPLNKCMKYYRNHKSKLKIDIVMKKCTRCDNDVLKWLISISNATHYNNLFYTYIKLCHTEKADILFPYIEDPHKSLIYAKRLIDPDNKEMHDYIQNKINRLI